MGEALGMIETRGLIAMIEAADAMVSRQGQLVGWRRSVQATSPPWFAAMGGGARRYRWRRRGAAWES